MRKLFALILVALLLGVGIVALIRTEPGYMLLAYGNYTLESSLWVGGLLILLFVLLLYGLISLIRKLLAGPDSLAGWLRARKAQAASRLTNQGVTGFIEGHWGKSRDQLVRGARHNEAPLVNYLLAARASQQLAEPEQVQRCLGAAADTDASAVVAVELTRAELALQAGQFQQALDALAESRRNPGRNPHVLDLMAQAYRGLGDWDSLAGLLPDMKKHRVLPFEQLLDLERETFGRLLAQAGKTAGGGEPLAALNSSWKKLPAEMKQDAAIVQLYVRRLIGLGDHDTAGETIQRELKHRWDAELVHLYGYVQSANLRHQREQAEKWLEAHPDDAQLLMCLGRLAARDKLWGVARDYFERSYRVQRTPEICAELGRLLEGLGEPTVATAYFREGLELGVNMLPELPMPGGSGSQGQQFAHS
jgi:HemY protein